MQGAAGGATLVPPLAVTQKTKLLAATSSANDKSCWFMYLFIFYVAVGTALLNLLKPDWDRIQPVECSIDRGIGPRGNYINY